MKLIQACIWSSVHWNHHSGNNQPHCSMVAFKLSRTHMSTRSASEEQSLDMPKWSCILRCICYMGSSWTKANLRFSRKLRGSQLVLPRRIIGTMCSVAFTQEISKSIMDTPHQSSSPARSNSLHAAGHSFELQRLDFGRNNIQLFRVQVSQEMVAEV